MAGAVMSLATRLDFASLEDLEAGFADRIGADAVFLARPLLGDAPDDLDVGASVHVLVETASGERALSFFGIVAWAYPASPRTPPGREPGAGILIERLDDDETRARVERMRRRPGAGGRVRAPGTRLPPLRLTVKAPSPAPRPAAVVEVPSPPPRLPASLFGSLRDDDGDEVTVPMPPSPQVAPPQGARVPGPPPEIVVSHPPAPQPRVMAMGLLVDQSVDPTPTPGPMPLPAVTPDELPPPHDVASQLDEPPPPLEIPGVTDAPPVLAAPAAPAKDLSLDALPDAPEAPAGALEQRQTDVDLLMSLDDADFFPAELEEQRSRAAAGLAAARSSAESDKRRLADDADEPSSPLPASPAPGPGNPALQEETVIQWARPAVLLAEDVPPGGAPSEDAPSVDAPSDAPFEDGPSGDGDVEMVGDEDIEAVDDGSAEFATAAARAAAPAPVPAYGKGAAAVLPDAADVEAGDDAPPPPVPGLEASPSDGIERSLEDDSTGEIAERGLSLDSIPSAEFETAEHTAVVFSPLPESFDTEHGDAIVHSTAEATASDDRSALSQPPRPLPDLDPFLPPGPPTPGIMGVAFMVSQKRATAGDPIASIEPFSWPRRGTKRWSAIDEAREAGGDALDEVISSSPWLSRDASARDPGAFEIGHTDPGVDVAAVVEKAVAQAAEDEDSVFSDAPPLDVRPPMQRPELDGDTQDGSELPEEARAALADSDEDRESDDNQADSDDMTLDEGSGLREALDRAAAAAAEAGDASDADTTSVGDEVDEFAETARDLKRRPTTANAEAQARLNVLQRALTRPRE